MGCFERIWIKCPKCRTKVEFQSKAGNACMEDYTLGKDEIPKAILADLDGDRETCGKCGTVILPKSSVTLTIETE